MELEAVKRCLDIMLEGLENGDEALIQFGIGELELEVEAEEKATA